MAFADQLRFSCPGCRLELSAPRSVAGVTAPCPGCGASITAPPAPAPVTEPLGQTSAPVPPEPEIPPAPVLETVQEPAFDEWAYDEGAAPDLPVQRVVRRRRKRAVQPASPDSSMSPEEKRELRVLLKLILSVLATAAITWAVYKLVSNSIMEGPPPADSRPSVRR